jgi:hypothetical protein
MSSTSLSEKLSRLANSENTFSDPYKEEAMISPEVLLQNLTAKPDNRRSKSKVSKLKKKDARRLSRTELALLAVKDLGEKYDFKEADEFDNFVGNVLSNSEEDEAFKNNLLSLGRKYSRETSSSKDTAEISKAYSGSEKRLKKLQEEIFEDKQKLQTDIDDMRRMRTKNFKALAEMVQTKVQYHTAELSAIREANNIVKSQFDILYKKKGGDMLDENVATASASALQQLFRLGRNNIISSIGGYEGVSGAIANSVPIGDYIDDSIGDEIIDKRYFHDAEESSDGDKFIEYENENVEYVLIHDETEGTYTVIAETGEGDIVEDYPMPSDLQSLSFDINKRTNSATDDLHRRYKLRIINPINVDDD